MRGLRQPRPHQRAEPLAALDIARNWSRLAHAGDSSTASPGCASAIARVDGGVERADRSPRRARVPASARAISGASRPISSTARQSASTADLSGRKSWPLPSPPAISTAGRSMPSSAACVAPTVVAFESSMNSTPPASATRSIRCGRPRNARSASSTLRSMRATVDTSASAASAFSALWRPTSASDAVGTSSSPPCASHVRADRTRRGPIRPPPRARWRRTIRSVRPGMRIAQRARVVAVDDLDAAAGEDARLRRRVVVDARVAVEMILGHVEHRRGDRRQRRRRLELEARQLEHEDIGPRLRRARTAPARRAPRRRCCRRPRWSRPAARHSAPVSAVTVVLPLEPVIASTFCAGRQRAREELDVADELDAARDRCAIAGWSFGTPGLIAIRSAPANVASVNGPVHDAHVRQCRRSSAACGGAARVSATRTRAPSRAR